MTLPAAITARAAARGANEAGAPVVNVPAHGPTANAPAAIAPSARSRQGEAALRAVTRGVLERAARYGTLRIETIPAMWPMTRHLVRRMTDRLVDGGLLERLPDGAVRLTSAGAAEAARERARRGD